MKSPQRNVTHPLRHSVLWPSAGPRTGSLIMKTGASLIALCAVVLLSIPSSAFARGHGQVVTGTGFAGGHGQVVTGSGFALQSRPFFGQRPIFVQQRPFFAQRVVVAQRSFFVERPFFAQRPFFVHSVVVERPFVARPFVGQPIILARPIIVPRREIFIVGGSSFGVVR